MDTFRGTRVPYRSTQFLADGKNAPHLAAGDDITTAVTANWVQLAHCPSVIVRFICRFDILQKREPQLRICFHQTDLDSYLQNHF